MYPAGSPRNLSPAIPVELPVGLPNALADTLAPTSRATNPAAPSQAPVVAQRAVETVLGLVDTQLRQAEQNAGTVNLSFKFGHEDLAVRVQLRDGEIHAQFRTDSPELRSALATEWRSVSAAAPAGSARLTEAEFVPASAPAGGFSASTQGQGSFQQQSSPQSPPSLVPPELRPPRRFATETSDEAAPRSALSAPGSLHLTALA